MTVFSIGFLFELKPLTHLPTDRPFTNTRFCRDLRH